MFFYFTSIHFETRERYKTTGPARKVSYSVLGLIAKLYFSMSRSKHEIIGIGGNRLEKLCGVELFGYLARVFKTDTSVLSLGGDSGHVFV